MKYLLLSFFLAFCSLLTAQVNDWENPAVFGINKEKYHVSVIPFSDTKDALQFDKTKSVYYKSLNGVWKLQYAKTPETAPKDFFKPEIDTKNWADVKVPGSLENQGFSEFIFKNIDHPFTANEPLIPHDENPVASYRTAFELPSGWSGREVYLNFGGVESAFYLWINGQKVGYSENSYCTAEFNITPYIKAGKNVLAMQVFRFSDGSYLEDQDFWRLSGIFRDVSIYSVPKVSIGDYTVVTDLDENYKNAELRASFKIRNKEIKNINQYSIETALYDAEKKLVTSQKSSKFSFNNSDSAKIIISQKLINPKKWDTEHPYLYTLVSTLKDTKGKAVEVISSRVGVREIEIKDGVLMVNGVRVIIRGVNRHEHDPYTGRYVSRDMMIKDIILMKQNNINAVRTCHYNDDPEWYDLCDEYGIYLCAEANLESHFYWGKLSNDPAWLTSFLDRCSGLVEPYKNNASVLYWSLGNESGFGPNHVAMSEWIHKNEPTRPVHYNPAHSDASVDIVAPMYPSVEQYIESAAKEHRPIIMCEYAHAMGNSCGNMKEYWEPTYSMPRAQGGFIWDWVDQGFFKKNEKGKEYIANSGEFNDPKSQVFVGFDGMVLADRTVQPELKEYKYIIQPLKIVAIDALKGKFKIQNRYESANLNTLDGKWELKENGTVIQQGSLSGLNVPAGGEKEFAVAFTAPKIKPGAEYFMNFSFRQPLARSWAPKGHEVAYEQIKMPFALPAAEFVWDKSGSGLGMTETPDLITVTGKDFTVKFGKAAGTMSSLIYQGKQLIKQGPQLNLYRAPTDNDEMWFYEAAPACEWRKLGFNNLKYKVQNITASKLGNGIIEVISSVIVSSDSAGNLINNTMSYRIFPDGYIFLNEDVKLLHNFNSIRKTGFPRIGFEMILPEGLENYSFYGKGSYENYSDRSAGAIKGLFKSTVDEQYFPYSRPQTTGNHTGINWLSLTASDGIGLAVYGEPSIEASALHYSQNNLDKKSINDVVRQNDIYLDVDYRQRGLGGASCGPDVRDYYKVDVADYNYSVRFKPVNLNQGSPSDFMCESPIVSVPVFSIKDKYVFESEEVAVSSATPGAEVRFTTDGTEPTESSSLYSSAIKITKGITIKVKAFKKGSLNSPASTAAYDIKKMLLDDGKPVKGNQQPADVKVKLGNIKQFGIIITDPDNNDSYDHADLIEARFIKKDGSVVYLCDLKPFLAFQGYNYLSKDLTCDGNPITLMGVKYKNSLSSHSYGEIWYNVSDEFTEFQMLYGVDDDSKGRGSSQIGLKLIGILK